MRNLTKSGEYCLQKSLLVSGEVTITNYLKQNDRAYQIHMQIDSKEKGKM